MTENPVPPIRLRDNAAAASGGGCLELDIKRFGALATTSMSPLGQCVGVAGQEPTAVGLFAVDRDPITGELRRFPAGARGHRQRIPAPRVGDFADDHDLFQLAAAKNPNLLVSGREVAGKSIPADRRLARVEEHDIVRHQREQADQIAGVDGIDPGRVYLADCPFIRSHLQPPPPNDKLTCRDRLRDP